MVGWHPRLNGYEFEQTLGDSGGQRSQACCSPQGHKESDNLVTEQQTTTDEKLVRGWEDLLEEEMAMHSSILAWRILWTEKHGELLHSIGSHRVRHN